MGQTARLTEKIMKNRILSCAAVGIALILLAGCADQPASTTTTTTEETTSAVQPVTTTTQETTVQH
jgi:uncharacterized lipoprotein YajG